ncbi:MBOAT, membrane-bound O-acyltransferase family-domain-containing protein [Fusarium sp. MPI-SDFR-AT-0072]|uniref:O-acyltransferase n=1 Tax=Fusarium oxysporum f. sp. rapae TaxID=485398 RepID=A0A8J5TW89_FUSOX|nr:Diacylglycerol O-acyltransferase 1C [Fusarium oxysporum f. sp. rapae]KAH7171952.1 MBOAT, membrane-bound O-acyltransferase family-domain-containing protein [Fusarium sp. MPI-SDFR-AT-0072]
MNSATATSIEISNGLASVSRRSGHDVTQNEPNNRTNGNGNGTATTKTPKKPGQKYRHVAAVHKQTRPSCLSHDSDAAPSFIGFRNLMVIVLVVGNLRLMIENIQKYGVLICVRCHDYSRQDIYLGLLLYFLIPCHLLAAYLIELAAAQQARGSLKRVNDAPSGGPSEQERKRFHKTWVVVAWAHLFNITLALVLTTWVVYFKIHHPLIGTLTEMHAIAVWLKTASYAFTNRDLRHAYLHPVEGERELVPELYTQCPYPQNITFSNLVYFWWAPTLVYQPVYPRTDKIRWVFVAKRVGEIFGLSVFMWVASAQYAAPVLRNSLDKIASLDLMSILERLLKLSTISLVIWLAGFFALFQSFLNALAEVLRFGDRSFYDDWWNSESLGAYWRTWNKPVYTYFKRHLYMPMIGRGWSPQAASFVVFLVSAILHEILVGVPTHNIIGVAFLGMFLQLPLIALTKPLENMKLGHTGKIVGNTIFWVSFTIFGQPFAALMYFYAWQAKYGSVSKQMTTVSS